MMSLRPRRSAPLNWYNPYFRVSDWDTMTPLMQQMLDQTMTMPGWDNFGWSRAGDRLQWRSAFDDVDDMMAMVDRTNNLMNSMLAGPASLDRLDLVGAQASMGRLMNDMNQRFASLTSPQYFENMDEKEVQTGFFRKELRAPEGALSKPNMLCTMTPHYDIEDWQTAKPLMQAIINKSYSEPGCTYFSWTKSGDKLQSRETFTDGEALKAHVESIKPLMEALKTGPAKLERLEISGPDPELEKIKEATAFLSPEYFALEGAPSPERIQQAGQQEESPAQAEQQA